MSGSIGEQLLDCRVLKTTIDCFVSERTFDSSKCQCFASLMNSPAILAKHLDKPCPVPLTTARSRHIAAQTLSRTDALPPIKQVEQAEQDINDNNMPPRGINMPP